MHIVVGEISAHYTGRGDTKLAPYNRIIIEKADGTVSIHGDKGFKPMNYMTTVTSKDVANSEEGLLTWTFKAGKEKLVVTFHQIYDEINLPLGDDDPGYASKDQTEHQLQEWLSKHIHELDPTLRFITREHQTGDGPVDLLVERGEELIAVEVKRVAPMVTVSQVLRYRDALREQYPDRKVTCMIAALEFKDKTYGLARKRGVEWLQIPAGWHGQHIEEINTPRKTLFDL